MYIGEIGRRLADRFRERPRDIINGRNDLPVPAHFDQTNHTLENMKVAVLKAGLANQEYRKKQEMRSIFNYGTVGPSGLTQYLSFTWITRFLHTRAPARAITCDKRASMQSGGWADLINFLTVFTLVHWRKQHGQNVPDALNCTNVRSNLF